MSDTPQGPGWWQASDGKFYPPQGGGAPPAAPQKKGGCLKIGLILLAVFAVLGIGAVALLAQGAKEVSNKLDDVEAATENAPVDPANPDAQKEDQNVAIGEEVRLSGYTTTVSSATFQPEISDFEKDGYIVADVTIANRDDKAQSFNYFDFKLQTPGGQVIDPDFTSMDGLLESGDLIKGGTASGKVVWKVGAAKGDFIVIYKPDPFDAARGLWKVTI
jgi:hypothetical protein